jgi:DNA-binding transcriptional ArsR family regulator
LQQDKKAVDTVFRLATAFTHPRRVEIYQKLRERALSLGELRVAIGIPGRALLRHLNKLQSRGFIEVTGKHPRRRYVVARHLDPWGRTLARMILESE